MTSTASTATPPPSERKADLVFAADANEWGQITGLEPHASYFVMRKPTAELTKEKSKEMLEEVKAFLHEHRVLSEQQMNELNARYGEPAKQRINEIRTTLEKRFDEISREIETRIEKLETELNDRGILRTKQPTSSVATANSTETPGEMPQGNGAGSDASAKAAAKKGKKAE